MARYMLLIHQDAQRWAAVTPEEMTGISDEYFAVTKEMMEAGVHEAGDPLERPDTARTVAGDGVVTDGPFAEAAEFLGGFYILDVADQDAAAQWAAKLPGVRRGIDRIEVRPIRDFMKP